MKKVIFTLALALGFTFAAYSQDYNSAIGLRLGFPNSVSYKHFISEQGAIEAFAGFRSYAGYGWFNVAAAYEHHWAISSVDGLSWYAGGGASAFFYNYDAGFLGGSNTSIGILGALGLDYKFEDLPLNLSLDWMPILFLNGFDDGVNGGYGALSVRYVIK